MRKSSLPLLALIFAFHAAPAGKFALTIDNIMRGPGLYGYEPAQVRWSGDGERIYFQWKQASDPLIKDLDTYVVGRDGSGLKKLSEAEAKLAPPASGATTLDKKRTVYSRDGDMFLYDANTGQTQQLTKTEDVETNPHFTRDGKRIAFTRANNLYVMTLDTGSLVEMTDIRTGRPLVNPAPVLDQDKGRAEDKDAALRRRREEGHRQPGVREERRKGPARSGSRTRRQARRGGSPKEARESSKAVQPASGSRPSAALAAHTRREVRDRERARSRHRDARTPSFRTS